MLPWAAAAGSCKFNNNFRMNNASKANSFFTLKVKTISLLATCQSCVGIKNKKKKNLFKLWKIKIKSLWFLILYFPPSCSLFDTT